MNTILRFTKVACTQVIVVKAVKVSLLVGTLLNIINQGEILFSGDFEQINVYKLLFTYAVPYLVTTYTATSMHLQFHIGSKAVIATDLECLNCHEKIKVEHNALIPECKHCGVKTRWKAI